MNFFWIITLCFFSLILFWCTINNTNNNITKEKKCTIECRKQCIEKQCGSRTLEGCLNAFSGVWITEEVCLWYPAECKANCERFYSDCIESKECTGYIPLVWFKKDLMQL